MFNDKGNFECCGRLKSKDKDKLTEKFVGIVVEIGSDTCLVYVIYTTNLFLYLYSLFMISDFICNFLFLSQDKKNMENDSIDVDNVISNVFRVVGAINSELVFFFVLLFFLKN